MRRPRRCEVAKWRAEVGRLFGAEHAADAAGQHLKPFVRAFALSRQPFDDLVDGVEMDLHRSRYDTFDELIGYCRRVASAVGLICIEIFGCRDSRSREYAFNLGLALQLTNIIRDVKADLAAGPHLPAAGGSRALRRHRSGARRRRGDRAGPQAAALRMPAGAPVLHRGRAGDAAGRSRKLVAAEIMGGIYFEILQRIERPRLRRVHRTRPRAEARARADRAADLGDVAAVGDRLDRRSARA